MAEIRVWTKQNSAVLDQLERDGRFIADSIYMRREMEDTADIILYAYDWLSEHMPRVKNDSRAKPDDARYPIWLSLTREGTMLPESGYAVLELSLDEDSMVIIDASGWTRILNYSYLPADEEDMREHIELMDRMGISDCEAVMTDFHPEIKMNIIKSWERLFAGAAPDDRASRRGETAYGLIWEVRREDVRDVY